MGMNAGSRVYHGMLFRYPEKIGERFEMDGRSHNSLNSGFSGPL